jgi:hypothetical protein
LRDDLEIPAAAISVDTASVRTLATSASTPAELNSSTTSFGFSAGAAANAKAMR